MILVGDPFLSFFFFFFLWVVVKISNLIRFVLLKFSEAKIWYQPECTGSDSDGHVGPTPRAFHVAVAVDCHMFVFGGRGQRSSYCFLFFYFFYFSHYLIIP
jgi:hypothetical protein